MINEQLKHNLYIRWNRRIVIICLFLIMSQASMNYYVDPYQIFHSNQFVPSSTSNERFNKIEYLLRQLDKNKDKDKPNAFLLGSSRMGVFHPHWFNTPGRRFYNLSVFSGDTKDSLQMLIFLKKKGLTPKEVIIGIDLFPFIEKQRLRPASLQHHPLVVGKSYFSYYLKHLFSSSFYQSTLKIQQHYGERSFSFDYTTGQWSLAPLERQMKINLEKYQQRFFKPSTLPPMKVNFQSKRFMELKQLNTWLLTNNIKARYFIHPFSHLHQQRFTANTFARFRRKIKDLIPNVLDFSTKTEWTHNITNYYEKKHYRVSLAKELATKLATSPVRLVYD